MAKVENEKAVMQEEPPYKRRSPLWQYQKEIRGLIKEGYSYRQILARLGLTVGISRLAAFARDDLGITSRSSGPKAEDKRAGQDSEGAEPESTQTAPPAKPAPASISAAFESAPDPLAEMMKRFRKS